MPSDKGTPSHGSTATGVREVSPPGFPKQAGRSFGEGSVCAHVRAGAFGRGEGKEENNS